MKNNNVTKDLRKMDISTYFLQGGVSGMVGVVISHPFDTVKTHMQNSMKVPYNLKVLYRGIAAPLLGVGFEKAVVFGIYTNTMNYLKVQQCPENLIHPCAGALAGFSASFIVTPVERIKILLQTNKFNTLKLYSIPQLYRGLSVTFTRETPGFAIYFSIYNQIKEHIYNNQITLPGSFITGGIAGATSWLFIFPQDIIKTRIQSSTISSYKYHIKQIYTSNGLRGFYRGFHLALMRAMPLHAGTFMTMELLTNWLTIPSITSSNSFD